MTTFSVKVEGSVTPPSGKTSWSEVKTADGLSEVVPSIPDPSTDFLVNLVIDLTAAEAIWFYSDQDITIYTNDLAAGAPDDTIVLKAGVGQTWVKGGAMANMITVDVATLRVTNASGAIANCKFGVLQDVSAPA